MPSGFAVLRFWTNAIGTATVAKALRTPLTLLRLRAENVENAPEREKMLATIAEIGVDGCRNAAVRSRRSKG
jgi:hypothetical protein